MSVLPDELMEKIFSNLEEVRQVGQTSILSKTWKNLWQSTRNLLIDDQVFFSGVSSTNFAETAFRFHKCVFGFLAFQYPRKLDRFRLRCPHFEATLQSSPSSPDTETNLYLARMRNLVYGCLIAAADCHAQEVYLENIPFLPHHLDLFDRYDNAHTKILHLTSIAIPPTFINNDMLRLYLTFLETLTIQDCSYSGIKLVRIYSRSLKNLTLENNRLDTVGVIESCVLELISLPNLTNLEFKGYMFKNYIFKECLPALVTANLDTKVSNNRIRDKRALNTCFNNVLKRLLSDAKSLAMKIDNGFRFASPRSFSDTEFHNLKVVQFSNFRERDIEHWLLPILVENAVGLEKITIRVPQYKRIVKFTNFGRKLHSFSNAYSQLAIVFLFKSREVVIDKLSLQKPVKPSMVRE